MKTIIIKSALVIFLAFAIQSCQTKVEASTSEAVDEAKIRAEIQDLEDVYAKALNHRDVDGMVTYYAEDAQSYETGKEPMLGKMKIRSSLTKQMQNIAPGLTIQFDIKNLLISSDGGQVVETGGYEIHDESNARIHGGNFMAVFEKRDGKYLCVREFINDEKRPQ